MSDELTTLEVGKSYVFKDEESKQEYLSNNFLHTLGDEYHKITGFLITEFDEVFDEVQDGWVEEECVIEQHEIPLFKEYVPEVVAGTSPRKTISIGGVEYYEDKMEEMLRIMEEAKVDFKGNILRGSDEVNIHSSKR